MITSKKELAEYVKADNAWYCPKGLKERMAAVIGRYPQRDLKRYLYFLRKQEYYINTAHGNRIKGFLGLYYEGRKNALGNRMGIEIAPNCFGKGLQIWHGNIIVNRNVQAGEGCVLHGGNCIGNNGREEGAPVMGNKVDIGYGAILIGKIYLADQCVIGANALVNRSFEEQGTILARVPAENIK